MALLGHYGVSSDDSLTFTVDFDIPDNCNYKITASGKTSYIEIELDAGQTKPSTTFKSYTEDFLTTDGYLDIEFKQTQGGVTNTKPKMKITQS